MLDFTITYDETEKIWYGPAKNQMFNENVSVGEIALFMMRSKNPQEICQISDSENTTLTYGQALTAAICVAQHFRSQNLTVDDVIGIMALNCMENKICILLQRQYLKTFLQKCKIY